MRLGGFKAGCELPISCWCVSKVSETIAIQMNGSVSLGGQDITELHVSTIP